VQKRFLLAVLALCLSLLISCGGGSSSSGGSGSGGGGAGTGGGGTGTGGGGPISSPSVQHVGIVVFENQNYADVVGNSAMPYLNTLIQQNALATQFYANVHPSIGNYFMMTTGQVVNTNDSFSGTISGDNVTTALNAAGKTWKSYAESLPQAAYVGGDQYPYIKHHNPFAYFDNVRNDSAQRDNIVPFTQLSADLSTNSLPDYFLVVPNDLHNGHDCPSGGSNCPLSDRLGTIDSWLQANLRPMLADSNFASHGILIITFDESANDNTMGGGRIAVVFVGGLVKSDFQSTTIYQFPSLLRFTLKTLGVTTYPGAAAQAADMDEFLK
jgi:acid phosphatase